MYAVHTQLNTQKRVLRVFFFLLCSVYFFFKKKKKRNTIRNGKERIDWHRFIFLFYILFFLFYGNQFRMLIAAYLAWYFYACWYVNVNWMDGVSRHKMKDIETFILDLLLLLSTFYLVNIQLPQADILSKLNLMLLQNNQMVRNFSHEICRNRCSICHYKILWKYSISEICLASTYFDHYRYQMSINEMKTIKHLMLIRTCCICYVLNITQRQEKEPKNFVQFIQK
jgi:hypothetical protein